MIYQKYVIYTSGGVVYNSKEGVLVVPKLRAGYLDGNLDLGHNTLS